MREDAAVSGQLASPCLGPFCLPASVLLRLPPTCAFLCAWVPSLDAWPRCIETLWLCCARELQFLWGRIFLSMESLFSPPFPPPIKPHKRRDGERGRRSKMKAGSQLKCIRPDRPAHGGVMLCTIQCRPAPARAITLVHSKETKQDNEPLLHL